MTGAAASALRVPPVVLVPLDRLRRAPGPNPNLMSHEHVVLLGKVIGEFGFLQPILVVEDHYEDPTEEPRYIVIDGHHRLDEMVKQGATEIPCVVLPSDTPPEDVVRLRIALNRLRGNIDMTIAGDMLDELIADGMKAADLQLSGMTLRELNIIVNLTGDDDGGLLDGLGGDEMGGGDEPPSDEPRKGKFIMKVEFQSAEDLREAKEFLRAAAPGGSRDLTRGFKAIAGMKE